MDLYLKYTCRKNPRMSTITLQHYVYVVSKYTPKKLKDKSLEFLREILGEESLQATDEAMTDHLNSCKACKKEFDSLLNELNKEYGRQLEEQLESIVTFN